MSDTTMSKQPLRGVMHHLRKLSAIGKRAEMSDHELLDYFVLEQDEAAFTVLVERHAPMVHGVCRRTLANSHDADDACQATFLVLARKASSIRKQTSLSSWLHGVACRIAANLVREQQRRRRREQANAKSVEVDPHDEIRWREVKTLLDEELQNLPSRYQSALILCYLEGKTRDEAARELGLTSGSLHGLLERGRAILRNRLTNRGVTLSMALLGTALNQGASHAGATPTLVVSSVKSALAYVGGQSSLEGGIAPQVLHLTQEALKVMFWTKVKTTMQFVLCACLLASAIGGMLVSSSHAQGEKDLPKKPARNTALTPFTPKPDPRAQRAVTDEEYIRRLSLDLRGHEPSPIEIHFFVTSKAPKRRGKLLDLLIQERLAKKDLEAKQTKQTIEKALEWLESQRLKQEKQPKVVRPTLTEWTLRALLQDRDAQLKAALAQAQAEAEAAQVRMEQALAKVKAAEDLAARERARAKALRDAALGEAKNLELQRKQAEQSLEFAKKALEEATKSRPRK